MADQLGVSRRIAVEAYAQLGAEGYLELRQGAYPRVSSTMPVVADPSPITGLSATPRVEV